MKIKYIIVLCVSFLLKKLYAHEQIVHQAITVNAAESALETSLAFKGFTDLVSADLPLIDATNFMVQGSFDEDFGAKEPMGPKTYGLKGVGQ